MNYLLRGISVLATVGVASLLAFSLPSGEAHGDGGDDVMPKLAAQELAAGMRQLPYRLFARPAAARLMEKADGRAGQPFRRKCQP